MNLEKLSSNMLTLSFSTLITVVFSSTLVLGEPQVPCFFIFGDSLVDNGNNNFLHTTAKVNFLPYGIDFPAGPTGRFTNGRNIADIIAELLGFEKFIPPFSEAQSQDILRGLNYGSGGAGILDETGENFGEVISMNEQLRNHEIAISRIGQQIGGERAAAEHLSWCLYYVGMGNNDYLANYLPQFYSSTNQYSPQQFADILIAQFSNQLRKLYDYGARKIAVFGIGKLGCTPLQLAAYGPSDGSSCLETSNDVVRYFNENLRLLIEDLNTDLPGAKFLYGSGGSHNESYGNIKIMNKACCGKWIRGKIKCVEGAVVCSNREDYFFWDDCHPTEAANLVDANVAYKQMYPLYPHPINDW